MPLLDGKYEILREEHSGQRETLFEASAPDGSVLRIVWFDVSPELERSFELYRRGLRKLQRSGHAALFDVVSRPGAHYVAWHQPAGGRLHNVDPELQEAIEAAGFTVEASDIRRSGRSARVYGMAWADAGTPTSAPTPPESMPASRIQVKQVRSTTLPQSTVNNSLALAILLLAAVALLGSWYQRTNSAAVTVSDVTGLLVNPALTRLAEAGLRAEPVAVSSAETPGTVLATEPAAGTVLPRGSQVTLEYAFPLDQVRPLIVPDLTGLEWPADVDRQLASGPLSAGTVSFLPSDLPAGTVIAQSETAGTAVAEGTLLNLLVSSGEPVPSAVLPDLTGLTLEQALVAALDAGLEEAQLSILQVRDVTARPGTIVRQDPAGGEEFALAGARLELAVAAGDSDMEPLPSFIGMQLSQARAAARGFDIRVVSISDTTQPAGVVAQEPEAGSWVSGGTLVLTVNEHPRLIPVPDPDIHVLSPEERGLAYVWFIEPGIPQMTARVYATSLEGQEFLVSQRQVSGGEWVQGTFDTAEPMVTFRLTLNGEPYGDLQQAR